MCTQMCLFTLSLKKLKNVPKYSCITCFYSYILLKYIPIKHEKYFFPSKKSILHSLICKEKQMHFCTHKKPKEKSSIPL